MRHLEPHAPPANGPRKRVAIVGSGMAGLAAAHRLNEHVDVSLFEAGNYFGGHTHTVDVRLPDAAGRAATHGVDTGFLVFNERTYPQLIALFAELGVATAKSDMSFSVQAPGAGPGKGVLEWSGSSLGGLFAQRSNLLRPKFWRMLLDIVRFNRVCTALAISNSEAALAQPLGEFLKAENFSGEFTHWYFLPMLGCIWSCPTEQMLQFPVATMIRFCHNHGLLQITDRPQWWTVQGGARNYVDKIVAKISDKRLNTPVRLIERIPNAAAASKTSIRLTTDERVELFDEVVLAAHSDQALGLLAAPSAAEQAVLGAIKYQHNLAVLHTDTAVLPSRKVAWAAWNYERAALNSGGTAPVCLHYWLNALQPLPFAQPVIVSLNPIRKIEPQRVLGEYDYAHPVFDLTAIRAQGQVGELQGQQNTYFCGAWTGYGFHEDALKSGLQVADQLLLSLARSPA
jgi:uncharacterized protein